MTGLPESVVRQALSRTTPLSGLSDQSVDTLMEQLRFNREHGTILQSDVWTTDQSKARREILTRAI
ncbi:hypothetical protein D3C83_170020 [compost metagenome]